MELLLAIAILFIVLNILSAIAVVFFERKSPVSTWAWLMVILFIPIFGFIIYVFFGKDGRKQKIFQQKEENDEMIFRSYEKDILKVREEIRNQNEMFKNHKSLIQKSYDEIPHMLNFEDLANMNLKSNSSRVTYNNKVKLFHDGTDKFESLIEDIRNAKSFIHMQYYIIKNDALGRKIIKELTEKAKQGLEVKLIYDSMGGRSLNKKFFKEYIEAGGVIGVYLKTIISKVAMRLNYRNHRKIAVIDGQVGYVGGYNIGEEYLGHSKKFGYWRDTHVRIEGDAVDELELRFIMDWSFVSDKTWGDDMKYFPEKNSEKGISIQIVSSGPDNKLRQIKNGYFKMINEAEKNIYIVTPYFIPDDSILESIRIAALSGIDVKILIPGKPDHVFVYWANLSFAGELLNAGARFYRYDKKSFVHSKLVMVDGIVSSVGTANMDVRSFNMNFESNAFIYDKDVTKELEQKFNEDLEKSSELTLEEYNMRPKTVKFLEAISRLISPIL